ncbi:LysR family transcriptional regulator [Staphylococcus xylosus]|uniref:LysR family transcriptional regulator n=1 Tax=Staphylococcus xylosus TaxID=1288 RepID=UPI002DB775E5|nr:LysR family transcriptional regulator [Staphylococcus xylosus]MEB6319789.1 LysR family transcriptional regulator [Staphylococcus xylosus]
MNINDLYIYITVYDCNSINRASKALGYAQSNISQRVQVLEKYFNKTFFIRNKIGIKPTIEGDIFYEYSKAVIYETDKLKNSFNYKKQNILCSELLFNIMYNEKNFNVLSEYNFNLVSSSQFHFEISKFVYDKVISFQRLNSKNYNLIFTSSLKMGLYKNDIKANTSNLPLIINTDTKCPLRILSLELVPHKTFIELDSLEAILNVVKCGEGIAILPEKTVENLSLTNIIQNIVELPYYEYEYNIKN